MEFISGLPVVVETFPEFYETGFLVAATSLGGRVEIYFSSSSTTRSRIKAFPLARVRKYSRGTLRPLSSSRKTPPPRLAKVRALKAMRARVSSRHNARAPVVSAVPAIPPAIPAIPPAPIAPVVASASAPASAFASAFASAPASAPAPARTGGGYWTWFWAGVVGSSTRT